jgi:hypothetical protein
MNKALRRAVSTVLFSSVAVLACSEAGRSEEARTRAGHRRVHATAFTRQASARSLTVRPPQRGVYANPYVGCDPSSFIGQDDDDAYGNVASFNPAPAITSGVQFPFGLDGVGGYGSDLGFEAGQSETVYQR